ncbi:MAG TPA: DUF4173 domain-containing protein [Dehalococcoidia bacterium]|nr:DUF4173 domain-containing protein [Dehalococcoidia bacterium]
MFFAVLLTVRANGTLTILNTLAVLGILALLVTTWDRRRLFRLTLSDYALAGMIAGTNAALRPLRAPAEIATIGLSARARRVARPALLGVMLALPFLGLFTFLFASADAGYARALDDLWGDFGLGRLIARTIFTLAFGWVALGLIDLTLGQHPHLVGEGATDSRWSADKPAAPPRPGGPLSIVESGIALGLIVALFATFVLFQVRYFFLPQDQLGYDFQTITYSEYAREGFFQLLIVAALAISLMVACDLMTRRSAKVHHWIFNGLTAALITCTLVVLISSFRRLQLYGLEHSFTHLRLFSHSFTVWLAVILILLLASIALSRPRVFSSGLFTSALIYLATLNAVNPDVCIATANLDHAMIYGKPLDRRNFVPLGEDAVPALLPRLDELDRTDRRAIEQVLYLQLIKTEQFVAGTG